MKKQILIFGLLCLLTVSSAQNGFSISGTLFARAGSSLSSTYVVGCYVINDDCDEQGSEIVQVSSNSSSAAYTLGGLVQNREYLMLAWRDLNKNQEIDKGDELGVSQVGGKAVEIKAPAQRIDLRLALFNGDFDALLNQAEQPPAPTQTGALVLSGTVRPAGGSSLSNTAVIASIWENGQYNQSRSKAVSLDNAGRFNLANLEKTAYVLFAWRDLDNNGTVNSADEVAPYRVNGKLALVTPPTQNITLQFEKGDSSLDALVDLTMSRSNPPANNTNTATGSIPRELLGEFSTTSTTLTSFYNPATGSFAPPSGNAQNFEFFADGTYTEANLIQSTSFSCTTSIFIFRKGTFIVNGAQMTRAAKSGTEILRKSCYPEDNRENPAKLDTVKGTWRFGADSQNAAIVYLYLTGRDGAEEAFRKIK